MKTKNITNYLDSCEDDATIDDVACLLKRIDHQPTIDEEQKHWKRERTARFMRSNKPLKGV